MSLAGSLLPDGLQDWLERGGNKKSMPWMDRMAFLPSEEAVGITEIRAGLMLQTLPWAFPCSERKTNLHPCVTRLFCTYLPWVSPPTEFYLSNEGLMAVNFKLPCLTIPGWSGMLQCIYYFCCFNQYKKSYSRSFTRVLIANDGELMTEIKPKEIMLIGLVLPSAEWCHQECGEPEEDLASTFAHQWLKTQWNHLPGRVFWYIA